MAQVELLSPAGNLDKLKTVARFGADAAYIGGKTFNLRAQSHNFNKEGLKQAVDYMHSVGKKVYVTLNIIAHNREIKQLPPFIRYLDEIGVDAVIVADMGVMELVLEESNLPIHISTQSSSTNWRTIRMWRRLGAKRVVLAREVGLDEIKRIKDNVPDMELETFIHGAMCMTYSGRCQLSSYMAERDGNRGVCANTCRWKFALVEEKRPGEYFPVYEDDQGSHIYNSKDLRTVEFLDKIIDAGVDSLKIEGRMKSMLYGATTAKTYRDAINSYYSPEGFKVNDRWLYELDTFSNRGYTTGFFFGKLDKNNTNLEGGYSKPYEMLAHVNDIRENGKFEVTLYNKVFPNTEIEILKPHGDPIITSVGEIINTRNNESLEVGQPNLKVMLGCNDELELGDVIRQKAGQSSEEQAKMDVLESTEKATQPTV